jgi:hypothetical protein
MLKLTSVLSITLAIVHVCDDISRGFEPGGFKNVSGIMIMVVWLYGVLVLNERLLGRIIMLLGSLLGSVMPLAHMRGVGFVGGRIANSNGKLFWVWTMYTLGVLSVFSLILIVHGFWNRRRKAVQLNQQTQDA